MGRGNRLRGAESAGRFRWFLLDLALSALSMAGQASGLAELVGMALLALGGLAGGGGQ